ncbi:MAG: hypothetical protein Q7U96_00270, partial [Chloroflexota bacterium]|nr:hypothetical protein [Chloroflexota bacterium]
MDICAELLLCVISGGYNSINLNLKLPGSRTMDYGIELTGSFTFETLTASAAVQTSLRFFKRHFSGESQVNFLEVMHPGFEGQTGHLLTRYFRHGYLFQVHFNRCCFSSGTFFFTRFPSEEFVYGDCCPASCSYGFSQGVGLAGN